MKDIKGLLFDADGTLLDTYGIILTSMRHTVNGIAGGSYADEELMARVGTPLLDQMLHFSGGDEGRAQELVDLYRKHNDGIHDEAIRPFPDTKEALAMLADAGFRMGVVTSKRHFMADRGLRMSGIAQYFDVLVASDDWPEHKPEPGPVLRGCELLRSTPRSAPTSATAPSTSRQATRRDASPLRRCGACSPPASWRRATRTCRARPCSSSPARPRGSARRSVPLEHI